MKGLSIRACYNLQCAAPHAVVLLDSNNKNLPSYCAPMLNRKDAHTCPNQ